MCWAALVDFVPSVGRCGLLWRGSNTEPPRAKRNLHFSFYVSHSMCCLHWANLSFYLWYLLRFTLLHIFLSLNPPSYHSSMNHMSTLSHQLPRTHSLRVWGLSEDDKHVRAHRPSVRQRGGRISCTHTAAHAKETLPKQNTWAVPLHCNRDFMSRVFFWVCVGMWVSRNRAWECVGNPIMQQFFGMTWLDQT